jgi:hypothetical protein
MFKNKIFNLQFPQEQGFSGKCIPFPKKYAVRYGTINYFCIRTCGAFLLFRISFLSNPRFCRDGHSDSPEFAEQ